MALGLDGLCVMRGLEESSDSPLIASLINAPPSKPIEPV